MNQGSFFINLQKKEEVRPKYFGIGEKLIKLKETRNKASISIFLFCLLISIFIWVLIKMSKDYASDISYKLNFYNPPSNQIISEIADSIIYLQIDSRGFDLFNRRYLKKTNTLNIDLSKVNIHNDRYTLGSYILSESILNQIRSQNEFPNYINRIYPDTLHLKLENTISKEIDIKLQLEIIPKQQHYVYGEITTSAQKTIITGPSSVIDTVEFISTENLLLKDIDKDQRFKINLINPYLKHNVSISVNAIEVLIPVQQFTESSISIPIKVNQPLDQRIKLFPETINIKYLVALTDYDRINSNMFSAIVNYDPSSLNYQKVALEQIPKFVKIISFTPETVEYLILKNND